MYLFEQCLRLGVIGTSSVCLPQKTATLKLAHQREAKPKVDDQTYGKILCDILRLPLGLSMCFDQRFSEVNSSRYLHLHRLFEQYFYIIIFE